MANKGSSIILLFIHFVRVFIGVRSNQSYRLIASSLARVFVDYHYGSVILKYHYIRIIRQRTVIMERRNLRSATRGLLNFHRYYMTSYGRRAFSYAGPHAWNSLPERLRRTTSIELFKRSLKTFLFGQIAS